MLTKKVAIYIPSTMNGNEFCDISLVASMLRQAKEKMAELFGGFTAYKADGGYTSPVHGLIEEQITIVQSYTDDDGLRQLPKIRAFAKFLAETMKQEVVSLEVNGRLEFITA